MEQIPLGFANLVVPAGSHIAYAYQSEAERYSHLLDFISAGLRNQEKCIAAVSEYTVDFWMKGLQFSERGPTAVPEDQLDILTAGQLLCGPTPESVRAAADTLGRAIESSFDGRWRGTRVCTGFTHLYHHERVLEDLFMADSRLNDLVRDKPLTILCTFAANRLHPRLLETGLRFHPVTTDGTSLVPNDGYLDPGRLAESLPKILQELRASGALVPPFAVVDFSSDTPIIRAGDEMDAYTAPQFEEIANWMVSVGHRELIVDLSGTTFVDAAAIGTLIRLAQSLEGSGGHLSIYDPIHPPRKVFQLVKLHERIPVRQRLDEAIEAVCFSSCRFAGANPPDPH